MGLRKQKPARYKLYCAEPFQAISGPATPLQAISGPAKAAKRNFLCPVAKTGFQEAGSKQLTEKLFFLRSARPEARATSEEISILKLLIFLGRNLRATKSNKQRKGLFKTDGIH